MFNIKLNPNLDPAFLTRKISCPPLPNKIKDMIMRHRNPNVIGISNHAKTMMKPKNALVRKKSNKITFLNFCTLETKNVANTKNSLVRMRQRMPVFQIYKFLICTNVTFAFDISIVN